MPPDTAPEPTVLADGHLAPVAEAQLLSLGNYDVMRRIHTLILGLSLMAGVSFAQVLQIPTRRILPDDIVQSSIQLLRFDTNSFAVRWTYTEAGATNMLAFTEAHKAETVRTVVGDYQFVSQITPSSALPPGVASYSEWRAGWLKHRTDKIFCTSEEDAKKIMAGLKK
jgi:hypothetical protein